MPERGSGLWLGPGGSDGTGQAVLVHLLQAFIVTLNDDGNLTFDKPLQFSKIV